ncbi:MAG TPA: hypothetical protein VH540_10450 [Ktedonobacterales bacterium]
MLSWEVPKCLATWRRDIPWFTIARASRCWAGVKLGACCGEVLDGEQAQEHLRWDGVAATDDGQAIPVRQIAAHLCVEGVFIKHIF